MSLMQPAVRDQQHLMGEAPPPPVQFTSETLQPAAMAPTDSQTFTQRVLFTNSFTAQELASGTAIAHLHDPGSVFHAPGFADSSQPKNALITGIQFLGGHNPCSENVNIGLNLFPQDSVGKFTQSYSKEKIDNKYGWLYANTSNDFGPQTSHSSNGYTNMVNLFPYEKCRASAMCYDPTNIINNKFIKTYGGMHGKDLWKNIIPFPTQNYYYVDQNHVIMNIIEQNWDQLGINPREEMLHEGQYYKMSCALVDNIMKNLQGRLNDAIPITNLDTLSCRMMTRPLSKWDTPPTNALMKYNVTCEMQIRYMLPSSSASPEEPKL